MDPETTGILVLAGAAAFITGSLAFAQHMINRMHQKVRQSVKQEMLQLLESPNRFDHLHALEVLGRIGLTAADERIALRLCTVPYMYIAYEDTIDVGLDRFRVQHVLDTNPVPLLQSFVSSCNSLAALQQMQEQTEHSMALRIAQIKDPKQKEPLAIAIRLQTAFLVHSIAERKAQLTRQKDGELLAGEIVPKPGRGSPGMYKAIRARV